MGELTRNLYQQRGVSCIELFRSNTPKSLCCKEFSQLVPLSAYDVQVVGNYAYVADDTSGLQIIDISNPTNPTLKGSYNTSGSANDVQIVGNYAYVADASSGLQIIDVSEFTTVATSVTLSISPSSVSEDGTANMAYTFTRSGVTTDALTVNYTVGGTATFSTDYTQSGAATFTITTGTVTFAANATTAKVTIDPTADTIVENNETVALTLAAGTGYTVGTTTAVTGTINNDDVAAPTLTIAAASSSRTEGNSGSKAFTFTVTRLIPPGNTTGSNNITWAVTGTGTNPANAADFVGGLLPSGTVSFAPGETSKVITVNVQGDTTVEPNENFTVTLSNPTNGATLGTPSTATVTIVDDDGSVPFLVDIRPGAFSSYPKNLTAVGSTLYFIADDDVNGYELWKSDGTVAGTVAVADIRSPGNLTAVGNTLFFTARDGLNGTELWKSDGTAAGTVLVKDIRPGSSSSYPRNLTAVGSTLFFTADDGVNGRELWKSDGTAAGTVLVRDIRPGSYGSYSYSSSPGNLTVVGNTLFFTANDNVNGTELWKSDGTEAGTVLVKDIFPGSSYSPPRNLTAVGSTLYFTANDDVNGTELWKSDGTAAGTVLVADIIPGASGYGPSSLKVVGNTLFFTANNGVNGDELWALNVGGPTVPTLAIAATNASQTEGNSGSKSFTFTVTRAVNTTGTNNVSWAVTGTGTNPANATDFVGSVLPSGTVSFAAGETSKVITVNVQGDATVELNENFTVTLSNATNGA
ncbi:ELWxxDGT repeat protein, partial [Microcystis aeruginosa]